MEVDYPAPLEEETAPLFHANGRIAKEVFDGNSFPIEIPETAHQICSDSWLQVGSVLTTGVNSAYILGYSATIMVPLGWTAGLICSIAATAISLYANGLVAKLHEYGGKRHIRYRDLAGFIYGKRAYNLTWALQYINLFMINTGFIILAGSSLKAVYVSFKDDDAVKLPYCIVFAGFVCVLFAVGIPHLSALGIWLGVSTFLTGVYTVITFGLILRDGMEASATDYSIPGTTGSKIFTTIGAVATLLFAFNTGMLPEIQATVKKPVVENMLKALYFQFTVGVIPLYAITFMGYWAYGASTPSYLLSGVSGSNWLKTTANLAAFLQTVISLHIFASPMYEYMDTKFGLKGDPNLFCRVLLRGGYLTLNTFVSALMPFLGDFMSLTGALTTIPLTFIIASHMFLVAKSEELSYVERIWHWINVYFFGAMSIAAAVSALRLIVVDLNTYQFFADL